MLINLFSVFDPSSYFGLSLNWLIIMMVLLIFPFKYFYTFRIVNKGTIGIIGTLNFIFKDIARSNYYGIIFIRVSTFIYLVIRNLIGLFPFVFAFTSHPLFTLGAGLTLWFSFFSIGLLKNFKNRIAHLVPEGRPLYLAPFIVLIELISHFIRPFTLSVRLAANIIAGHLIIILLAIISSLRIFGFVGSLIFQRALLILEFGVSVIQGFVFRILLLLYGLEYY